MFEIDSDMTIYITRGDVAFFSVTAEDNGERYKFQPGDVVRIKVTQKKNCENVAFQKDFPVLEETETVEILLTEEETKIGDVISKPVDYWYEVELNPYTNPQTIIGYDDDGPKIFKLFPEGRDLGTDTEPEDVPVVDSELSLTSDRPVQNQAVTRAMNDLFGIVKKVSEDGSSAVAAMTKKVDDAVNKASKDTERLDTEIAVERARINNLVANAGDTDNNAELLDVRTGADGTVYETAGEAVRGQVGDLKSDLSKTNNDLDGVDRRFEWLNVVREENIIEGKYHNNRIGTDTIENFSTSSSWNAYGIYPVNDGDEYTLQAVPATPRITLYDTEGILRGEVRNSVGSQPTVAVCSVEGYTIGYIGVSVQSTIDKSKVILLKTSDEDYLKNPETYLEKAKEGLYKLSKQWIPNENIFDELNGVKIAVAGDSISEGANNSGVGYAEMIANRTGAVIDNHAVSGSTWVLTAKPGGYRGCVLNQVQEIIDSGENPDVVILSGGYNDSQTSILNAIGTVQEFDAEHTDVFSGGYDTTTVVGCIEEALYRLYTNLPNAKIMYVITYPMGAKFSTEYVPVIRQALEKWCVPYVDFCKVGNMFNTGMPNASLIFTDNVHPNDVGYDRMSRYVEAKLKEMF